MKRLASLIVMALLFFTCRAATPDSVHGKRSPLPLTYIGAFAGVNYFLETDFGGPFIHQYGFGFSASPIEFGFRVHKKLGLGLNASMNMLTLTINESRMVKRLNIADPRLLQWHVSSSGSGRAIAMHMGMFYAFNLSDKLVADFSAMPGMAWVNHPTYTVTGWSEGKIRVIHREREPQLIVPTVTVGVTLRQKVYKDFSLAGRVNYTFISDCHFANAAVGLVYHPF